VATVNNGDETWSEDQIYSGNAPKKVYLEDLDNDGKDEIVVAIDVSNTSHILRFYMRNANGSYESFRPPYQGSGTFASISFGDVNGDGITDISNVENSNIVRVILNDGAGGALGVIDFPLGQAVSDLQHILVDLNQDGFADLVIWKNDETIPIRKYQNNGGTSISNGGSIKGANSYSRIVEFGDLTNDGIPQLVYLNNNGQLKWKENDGNGNFGNEGIILDQSLGANVGHVAMGDFNSDGSTDIADARASIGTYTQFSFIDEILMLPSTLPPGLVSSNDAEETITENSKQISVYPVPSTGLLYIDFESQLNPETSVLLIDLSGRVLMGTTVNSSRLELNLEHLSGGMYLLQFFEKGDLRHTRKIFID